MEIQGALGWKYKESWGGIYKERWGGICKDRWGGNIRAVGSSYVSTNAPYISAPRAVPTVLWNGLLNTVV